MHQRTKAKGVHLVYGSVDLLSHFAKCKHQKCWIGIWQEIALILGILQTLLKKLPKVFSTLHFKVKYQSKSTLPVSLITKKYIDSTYLQNLWEYLGPTGQKSHLSSHQTLDNLIALWINQKWMRIFHHEKITYSIVVFFNYE